MVRIRDKYLHDQNTCPLCNPVERQRRQFRNLGWLLAAMGTMIAAFYLATIAQSITMDVATDPRPRIMR